MKMRCIFAILPFIQECQWPDPRTPLLLAKISLIDNKICVTTAPQGDEKIFLISIDDGITGKPILDKSQLSLPISENECVPDFGFVYESGKRYHFTVDLVSDYKKRAEIEPYTRMFTTSFIVNKSNETLEVKESL